MKPIRKSMIAVAAFLSCAAAYALEVSSDEAREAVAGWASLGDALTGGTRFNASEITSVSTYDGADGIGRFYVVSFAGGGYAVTSGDTEISPILAYSESGEFVASDENPLWVLLTQDVAGRTKRLGNGEQGTGNGTRRLLKAADSANASAWARLRNAAATSAKPLLKAATGYESASSVSDLRVAPLCKTLWAQREANGELCYNYYTPSNYPCGCIATALAQVMKHFEWPQTKVEVGNHWYVKTVNPPDAAAITWRMGVNPATGESFPDLDPVFTGPAFGGPYDWANMPDDPASVAELTDVQRQAIGQLTRDSGIAVKMKYTPDGSSAYGYIVKNRLVDQFGYANAELIGKTFTADERKRAMLSSFDFGSPCFINITDNLGGGHAIVGDGYGYSDGRLYIHFNFGWGDHPSTTWYAPSDDGESYLVEIHSIVYNIWTPEICNETNLTIVSGRVLNGAGAPVPGQTVAARDRKTGATKSTTSNANGIYAFLLAPEATYEITAEKDGASAMAVRRVVRCVSNPINENDDGSTSYSYGVGECVGNQPGVDLTLSAVSSTENAWLCEDAFNSLLTGEWAQDITYGADGRAYVHDNAFTPFAASTGNVVTVEAKAQFCEYSKDYTPDATAQAAVRLWTNGVFQVWTADGWVDVEADGVTPVSGAEYTLRTTFDYTAGTYSVEVKAELTEFTRLVGVQSSSSRKDDSNSALQLQLENPTSSFPLAAATNCVTSVGFMGDTLFTSMSGDCRMEVAGEFATNEVVMLLNNAPFFLNTAKAAWLNKLGTKTTVEGKLSGMRLDDVNKAYLLNLDFDCLDDVEGSYTFQVTDINVGTDSVAVSVTLTRSGKVEQKINGTLNFYGAATLAAFKDGAAKLGGANLTNESFAGGETATATIPLEGETPPAFFNAKIEEE